VTHPVFFDRFDMKNIMAFLSYSLTSNMNRNIKRKEDLIVGGLLGERMGGLEDENLIFLRFLYGIFDFGLLSRTIHPPLTLQKR